MVHGRSIAVLLTLALILSGCAQLLPPGWNASTNKSPTAAISMDMDKTGEDVTVLDEADAADVMMEEPPATPAADMPRKTVVEGELVSFPNLRATDPDGDTIAYTFTPPLDVAGKWQTKVGDVGEYRVTITASDGKNSVSQIVIIEVTPKNRPPQIKFAAKEIKVKEGDTVTLGIQATDPDGDKVTLTYDGWMSTDTYKTTNTDAGFHEVIAIASDGTSTVRETIRVVVENVNRAPTINQITDIIIKEGDKITVNPTGTDPDGDRVMFLYGSPVKPDGTWQTTRQDVGKYRVNVTASDGTLTATTSFLLVVESLNAPPVITIADLIAVDEGMTVTLQPSITDAEGDELTISYAGWMNGPTYTTSYEDSGSHLVTITASDGINQVKKDITVMVNDVNRPPSFGGGAFS